MRHLTKLAVVLLVARALFAADPVEVTTTGTWNSGTFLYDGSGNIKAIGTNVYRYDTAGRLVTATVNGPGYTQTYQYDAFGNRNLSTTTPAHPCIGGINCEENVTIDPATNHIDSSANEPAYDAAGNLAALDGTAYVYDSQSMLRSQSNTGAQFIYTAGDERLATISSGGAWSWTLRDAGGKVLSDFTSSNGTSTIGNTNFQWKKDYIYRDGLLLAASSSTGTEHFHLDHLGTPRLITDANGAEIGAHTYFPFGAELALTPTESPIEAMKFTGHERDYAGSVQDLDYMHARYYGAAVARFMSTDPELDLNATTRNPQKWNRYSYVVDNPVLYNDTTGRQEAAGFAMDRDLQDLLAHRITENEYWARLNARAAGAAVGATPWAGLWGVNALMSWLGVGAATSAAGSGSVLLGETMRRLEPVAEELNAGTFDEPWTGDATQMMARNMEWLQDKIDSGSRIYDIGKDALRQVPSAFYAAETALLKSNGFAPQFVRFVMVNGKVQEMYEWVKSVPL